MSIWVLADNQVLPRNRSVPQLTGTGKKTNSVPGGNHGCERRNVQGVGAEGSKARMIQGQGQGKCSDSASPLLIDAVFE